MRDGRAYVCAVPRAYVNLNPGLSSSKSALSIDRSLTLLLRSSALIRNETDSYFKRTYISCLRVIFQMAVTRILFIYRTVSERMSTTQQRRTL